MNDDEKAEFVGAAVMRMARHTLPFIVGFVGGDAARGTARLLGTGFRLRRRERALIVTTRHVVDAATQVVSFGTTAVRGEAAVRVDPSTARAIEGTPLMTFDPPPGYPTDRLAFWPEQDVDSNDAVIHADFLVLHGFPVVRSHYDADGRKLTNQSLPFGSMAWDGSRSELEPNTFAIELDPSLFPVPKGLASDWLDPTGLAGSPVFRIGAVDCPVDEWAPEHSKLVGVVTEWQPERRRLLATKLRSLGGEDTAR